MIYSINLSYHIFTQSTKRNYVYIAITDQHSAPGRVLKGLGGWSLHALDLGGDGGEGRGEGRGYQGSHTH